MSDEMGFLDILGQDPNNVPNRLIYADWLEENGDPQRAELIRLWCVHDQAMGDEQERSKADHQARTFLRENPDINSRIVQPLEQLNVPDARWSSGRWYTCSPGVEIRRGFIESLTISGQDLLKLADKLETIFPFRELVIGVDVPLNQILKLKLIGRLHRLSLIFGSDESLKENVRRISRSRSGNLTNVRVLRLYQDLLFYNNQTGWDGTFPFCSDLNEFRYLGRAKALPALETVGFELSCYLTYNEPMPSPLSREIQIQQKDRDLCIYYQTFYAEADQGVPWFTNTPPLPKIK